MNVTGRWIYTHTHTQEIRTERGLIRKDPVNILMRRNESKDCDRACLTAQQRRCDLDKATKAPFASTQMSEDEFAHLKPKSEMF